MVFFTTLVSRSEFPQAENGDVMVFFFPCGTSPGENALKPIRKKVRLEYIFIMLL